MKDEKTVALKELLGHLTSSYYAALIVKKEIGLDLTEQISELQYLVKDSLARHGCKQKR
jgi:hypothetical protein